MPVLKTGTYKGVMYSVDEPSPGEYRVKVKGQYLQGTYQTPKAAENAAQDRIDEQSQRSGAGWGWHYT